MAAMALQLRSKHKALINPSLIHLFSSSSSSSSTNDENEEKDSSSSSTASTSSSSSSSSYFSDVKASLRQNPPPRRISPFPPTQSPSPFLSGKSFEEIRKNLSEFRRRSAAPSSEPDNAKPPSPLSPKPISFQELYKSNIIVNSDNTTGKSGRADFTRIRESLRQFRMPIGNETPGADNRFRSPDKGNQTLSPFSVKAFKDNLKLHSPGGSGPSSSFLGWSDSIFGREVGEKSETEAQAMNTEFLKVYSYGELGEKLRMLRPGVGEGDKNWFSLGELNQRLAKLREIEEKETESRIGGLSYKDLRDSLVKLKMTTDSTAKRSSMQRLAMLGQLGGEVAPAYKSLPPKDLLVEKYFHPDNMSSEDKLKLELKRVRDEFKMSESDCGSSRVQVAQLTTKIKHLSSVLHKKDKHSRKGLVAMVHRRKKLLKYLRRTDWDSYCFVLSKLGLRDNPDYKN